MATERGPPAPTLRAYPLSRFHCSLARRNCAKLHRQQFSLPIPLLHKRRGENGRNRKQGWAEFLSPPRRPKKSLWTKLGPPTRKRCFLAEFHQRMENKHSDIA